MDLNCHISPCLGTVFTNSSGIKMQKSALESGLWNPGTSKGNIKTTKRERQVTVSDPSLGLHWLQKRHQGFALLKPEENLRCYFWGFAELSSIAMELNWINKCVVWHISQTSFEDRFWLLCALYYYWLLCMQNLTQASCTNCNLKWRLTDQFS